MRNARYFSNTVGVLLMLVLTIVAAHAQGTATGTILGTVNDPSGAIVGGASVQVRNLGTGLTRTTMTDDQGRYRVPELNIGEYEVSATLPGFQTAVRTGITLTVGAQLVVDFQLNVGQQAETVLVNEQVSSVETQSTAVGVLVESKQIRDLPLNGRNYTQLIALNPGVTQITEGALGAGSGFYGNQTKYSIAGSRPSGQNGMVLRIACRVRGSGCSATVVPLPSMYRPAAGPAGTPRMSGTTTGVVVSLVRRSPS